MKYLFFLSLAFVFACEPNKSEEIKQIKKEALDIHDEVMPKMGVLRKAKKSLVLLADSVIKVDSVRADVIISASEDIAKANASMMDWMRNFEPEFEGSEEEMLKYFNEQKVSIEEVKKAMDESLARGEEYLNN